MVYCIKICLMYTMMVLLEPIFCHEFNPEGWKEASEWILASMDPEVEPCDDFYKYACGKWTAGDNDDGSITTEGEKSFRDMLQKIIDAIDSVDLSDAKTETFKKSLKTFYTQCKAQPQIEDDNDVMALVEEVYVTLLKYFGSKLKDESARENSTVESNMWRFVGVLQRVIGTPFPIEADVLPTEVGCQNVPTLHLVPSVSASLSFDENFVDKIMSFVTKHANVNASREDIIDTKKAILAFASNMSSLIDSFDKEISKRSDERSFYLIKYSQLSKEFPDIDWDAYLSGLLTEDTRSQWTSTDPTIVLEYRNYFENLSSLIKQHDPVTVINLSTVVSLMKYVNFLKSGELKYYDRRQLNMAVSADPCQELMLQYFNSASLRILVEEYKIDIRKWRSDLILMKDMTFATFRFVIHSTDWLDVADKMIYMEAINKIQFYGGIPSWIMNDSIVDANTPIYNPESSLIINDITAQIQLFKQKMKPLITGLMDDMQPNFVQNAYNDMQDNIRYLVGYQVPPLYSFSYPLAVKFGITGGTLGHELMHSFGSILYRHPGTHRLWSEKIRQEIFPIKKSAAKKLREKAECLIPPFDEYCKVEPEGNFKDGKCFIGTRTLEENLADAEGLKLAYATYKLATKTMGTEPPMDDLVHFSSDQILFISMAKEHCSPMGESKFPTDDPHSSGLGRVEQMFANFPAFSQAFGCKPGHRYHRNKTCSVYGSKVWDKI